MGQGRIGIVSRTRLLYHPSLLALIQALSARGYEVDIYGWDNVDFPIKLPPLKKLHFFTLPQQGPWESIAWRLHNLAHWLFYLSRQCHRERYEYIIGIDALGLILASVSAFLRRTQVVYFSMDLLLQDSASSLYRKVVKCLERFCNRSAAFTLIQDEDRAELLVRENRISPARVVYLPNAPLGEANPRKTKLLRKTLGLNDGRWIILHAGSVDEWTGSLELAQAARAWPESLAVVFHNSLPLQTEYQQAFLTHIDGQHTFLTQGPLALDQFTRLVRSADIGIALYPLSERDQNMFIMGLASGKIAYYLQCGLPVVATGLPTLRKFIERYRCGICIDGVDEVLGAIQKIIKDYEGFSQRALECFQQELQLDRFLPAVMERLAETIGSAPQVGHRIQSEN
jgi:glycosyltransferase involved in cell wall biosynthesis